MASRRMLASDIFTDEFFCDLTITERLLWIGIIVQCADDQGRLQDKPHLINSRIFPDDGLSISIINSGLTKFSQTGKITRYKIQDKSLIQINNWWTYQTPAWANPSKFPPPNDWIDRIKIHVSGNKVHIENWDNPGGYIGMYVPPVHKPIEEGDVNGDVNGEDEVGDFAKFNDTFQEKTHLTNYTPMVAIKAFEEITKAGATIEDMIMAIEQMVEKSYVLVSPASIVNPTINCMNYRLRKNKNNSNGDTTQDIIARAKERHGLNG